MRTIVQDILPVRSGGVYVSERRTRPLRVMITWLPTLLAMAPGTNIGGAPVGAGGQEIEAKMSEKVVNDMVAHAKSVADVEPQRPVGGEGIRESVSATETEGCRSM